MCSARRGATKKRSIHGEYVSILSHLVTQILGLRWGFEVAYSEPFRKIPPLTERDLYEL